MATLTHLMFQLTVVSVISEIA